DHVMVAHGGAWYESSRCAVYALSADHTGVRSTYSGCAYASTPAGASFTWSVAGDVATLAFGDATETLDLQTYDDGADFLGFSRRDAAPSEFDGCTSAGFPAPLRATVTCTTPTPTPTDT